MTATQGMTDDYDAHSQYQRAVADTGAARIAACVGAVSIDAHATFVVADYGCSTGKNSMSAVRTAVEAVRQQDSTAGSPSRAGGSTCSSRGRRTATSAPRSTTYCARLTARFTADPERDRFDDWTSTVVLSRN